MGKILPILLVLAGIGGGVGAGLALRPDTSGQAALPDCKPVETTDRITEALVQPEYVKLNNQFVVPVVDRERVAAMVVLSLSLEGRSGVSESVFAREPKLRDVFLQVLFDHANVGGFRGAFTASGNMESLRQGLLDAAQSVMGDDVTNVLITDIARQDV